MIKAILHGESKKKETIEIKRNKLRGINLSQAQFYVDFPVVT